MPVGDPPASAVPTAARPITSVQKPVASPHSAVAPLHSVSAAAIRLRRFQLSTATPKGKAASAKKMP